MNKTRVLIAAVLVLTCTAGALYTGHHTYYYLAHFIDGFTYMPVVEGSAPPVFGQPRTTGGQVLGWVTAAVILISAFVLDSWMVRKLVRA